MAHLRGVSVTSGPPLAPKATTEGVGLPGQRGPAVDNNGHAAGYGVDYNHTAVDSEGNPQAVN